MTGHVVCVLLLLLSAASAQMSMGSAMGAIVRVRVSFADGDPCDLATRVALVGSAGFTLAESSLSNQCEAEFFDVPAGDYRVQVSGANVTTTGQTRFTISPGMSQSLEVEAKHTDRSAEMRVRAASPFVSVKELGVPSAAEKEFEKANHLISKQDWAKAIERLQKAVSIYPQYASAYNNLGAVYTKMGEMAQARGSLKKAIAINDRFAVAYVNLARVSFSEKDFPAVEGFVEKALSLAVPDGGELTMLAFAQLGDGHLDQTIATSGQAHRLQLAHHAFVHLLAARADELLGKSDEYMAELHQFLSEEPSGPRADQVKGILAKYPAEATSSRSGMH